MLDKPSKNKTEETKMFLYFISYIIYIDLV